MGESDKCNLQRVKAAIATLPDKSASDIIAVRCNDKKIAAKRAQEASEKLYLCEVLKVSILSFGMAKFILVNGVYQCS